MKHGMGQSLEALDIFLRVIGQAQLSIELDDQKKRWYAYQINSDGTEDHQAFFTHHDRNAWCDAHPDRFPEQRADMDQYQLRQARWWTDTKIG